MSLSVEVLELFAEAQGFGAVEWMGDTARVITRKGKAEPGLWATDRAAYYREWRKKNPARAKAIVQAYQARHPERVKAKRKAAWARYYATNAERIKANARARHAAQVAR